MALSISGWSIRRPIPAIVAFAVLTILGLISFRSMPITRFPNIDIPIVKVEITQSGAAPSELESQVTKKVEDAVSSLNGVWHIISTVTDGSSATVVQFNVGSVDIDRALNDVKDKIAKIRGDLPRTIDEPVVSRVDVEGLPIVTYAASAPGLSVEELSWFVDDTVARDLQSVRGVGEVTRFGGVDREIRVALDPEKLLALGVTAAAVNEQVRADNVDLGGGRGEVSGQEQAIRTLAGARSVADLAALPIALPGGRKVRLDELGTVVDGAAEPRTFSRLFDEPIVAFGITRAKGASDVTVDERVAVRLAKIQAAHPEVRFSKVDTQVVSEVGNYHSTMETLIEGAALAVVVVFVFLRDLRATLVTALALPLSIIPTFWAMDAIGFSLNLVSLLAITLVTGILVDDAIVEIENIVRHMRMGKSAYRASVEAADEIGLAVIAISLSIAAIFAPVSFMGGIAGQYFRQFGLTVAIAVLFSLMVARFVTPVIAAYFLRAPKDHVQRDGAMMRGYTRLVRASVRHRWITVFIGALIFAGSLWSTRLLPSGFIPADDYGRALLAVELPPGSRLDDTDRVSRAISEKLRAIPEVRSALIFGGQILGGGAEPRKATFVVNFVHKSERAATQKELQTRIGAILADVPDIRYWFLKDNGQRDVSLIVAGPDIDVINATANQIASEMRTIPIIETPMSTAELERPELRITPKRQVAADLGVSTEALSGTVRVATLGDIDANLAKFNAGDRLIPIRVQLDEAARARMGLLQDLRVPTAGGGATPLSVVADVSISHGPTAINRYDRSRRVTIEGDLRGDTALGEAVAAIHALPTAKNLPPGVEIRETGDVEVMGEVFASFAAAMGAGLMMVYGLLVLLFGSFLQPITILISLPLSIGGAILALLITHKAMSMPVVIGILMLMGIVTKNAIMLVDFAVEEIGRGTPRLEALVEAGRKRARPIVMTTIAMAAGMFPSALGLGDGGGFRSPMAIAVIGGLIVSTLLSLIFVPAVFTVMDDVGRLTWRLFSRLVGTGEDEAPVERPKPLQPAASRPRPATEAMAPAE
ncbi:hydrophobe/amphiphile efflux-1 (HAE1) family protein [Roseiarcus fermentans]|uniref:Hydrophobe/amphiphile efflux-1 (HAE1) family protein n=1 Tax=Roseiarcus fermentans TaxID=1473586 RepID=A0A366F9E2_9HYPH|nr:efflux RND transporter permease subunit [Roseiarcus fermentans]RBP10580.1 hydrophobe/amphiphile efflux-1 (HAE1) family protein [Roseiarcus fermentans]